MLTRILMTGVVLMVAVGCAKKSAKKPEPTTDEFANVKVKPEPPTPAPNAKQSKKDADEPNWIKPKKPDDHLPPDAPGKPGYGIPTLPPGATNPTAPAPNPGVQPMPPGPGPGPAVPNPHPMGGAVPPKPPVPPMPGGVLQPAPIAPPAGTPVAPARKVEMADMKEVWVFVDNFSGASGKMPTVPTIYAALVEAESPAAALVKDNAILLTGATKREGVWAYEANALLHGGLVVSQNGVETLTAAQLQQRLRER